VTLYLGGWSLFGLENVFANPVLRTLLCVAIFAIKIFVLIYVYMWFRWTFPRYRYDQLMDLGWKWLIPAGLANIVLTGVWYVLAMPASAGGVFGFLKPLGDRYQIPFGGKVYFIATGFLVTVPLVWMLLAAINRRSRTFNLHAQRQLQVQLRQERLQKTVEAAETAR